MIIAVDFDGTIVEHKYPQIGKERPFAIATLKRLQAEQNILILWSVREGELLDEAVAFCRERGLEFYAVNSNMPEEETDQSALRSRKVNADIYIDDRNVGSLPDWGVIYVMVHNRWSYDRYLQEVHGIEKPKKKPWLKRIFGSR